jgi:hypothetical protein
METGGINVTVAVKVGNGGGVAVRIGADVSTGAAEGVADPTTGIAVQAESNARAALKSRAWRMGFMDVSLQVKRSTRRNGSRTKRLPLRKPLKNPRSHQGKFSWSISTSAIGRLPR